MVKPGIPPNVGLFCRPTIYGASMVKRARKKLRKRGGARGKVLPFERSNYLIIGAGLLLILLGYLAMLEGSVEGFLPLVVAPILLVTGYCVVIPVGILYRKRRREERESPSGKKSEAND